MGIVEILNFVVSNYHTRYEHTPSKNEIGVCLASCKTDYISIFDLDLWLQGHTSDLKLCCHLQTFSNNCAKYEHPLSKMIE